MRVKRFLQTYYFPILLTLIVGILFLLNYQKGTYLSGWDNLQTDLNPGLAIKRAFFSVWQEYQSFGLVSGLAHAADLVRSIFVWGISFILPQNIIRYFFHFFTLWVGALGMFNLLQYVFFNKQKSVFAFLGATFYILNLGTIQIFHVPFEPFSVFFAALPWEIMIFIKLLDKKEMTRKDLLTFIGINILATPQAYVQTLFIVYNLLLILITFAIWFEHKTLSILKRSFILGILILVLNSFWLLPQFYFLKTSGNVVTDAKTNVLSTDDLFYQNKEKGTIVDFMRLEGFYYDLKTNNNIPLFLEWKQYYNNPLVNILPFVMGIIFLIGIVTRRKYHLVFVFPFILIGIFFLSSTPVFEQINSLLAINPTIHQIFRASFTKFIIPYSLIASYFFASGLYFISQKVPFKKFLQKGKTFIVVGIFCAIVAYSLPAFQGSFFSPIMKVKIPTEYLDVITYFSHTDPNKRIALLPHFTFWGWFTHKWGYDGSGFLWYGIEQPIVSRTFDIWSNKSESYYWEMRNAIAEENREKFEKVLDKYNIDYLLLDPTLLPISSTVKGMQYDTLKSLLSQSKRVTSTQKFGDLTLYEIEQNKPVKNFISAAVSLPNIGPSVKEMNDDIAFFNNNDYQTNPESSYDAYYPFLDVMTETSLKDKLWSFKETPTSFTLSSLLPYDINKFKNLYSSPDNQLVLYENGILKTFTTHTSFTTDSHSINLSFDKNPIYTFALNPLSIENCGDAKAPLSTDLINNHLSVQASNGAINCFGYQAPFLDQKYTYLIKIESENIKGRPLFFYVIDNTKKQTQLETRLTENNQFFFLPKNNPYGLGYTFNFQNNSYKKEDTSNILKNVSIYTFPYQMIKNTYLTQNTFIPQSHFSLSFEAQKKNYYTYSVTLENSNIQTIILNQSFHPGWKAYILPKNSFSLLLPFLFNKELPHHVMINNWANGWNIPKTESSSSVLLIFLPQYLEYIGFVILLITLSFSFILIKKEPSSISHKK
jgi:hypothetical protein